MAEEQDGMVDRPQSIQSSTNLTSSTIPSVKSLVSCWFKDEDTSSSHLRMVSLMELFVKEVNI